MHPTLNLADSAISIDMTSSSASAAREAFPDRLSRLSKLLQESPQLPHEQSALLTYHLVAIESIICPSSIPPESDEPLSPPLFGDGDSPYAQNATPIPRKDELPLFQMPLAQFTEHTTLLKTITSLAQSLRARQKETRNLHALFMLKLSTCTKRIVHLEERIRELESGYFEEGGRSRLVSDGNKQMEHWGVGRHRLHYVRLSPGAETSVTVRSKIGTGEGLGVYGIESSRRGLVDTGYGRWDMVDDEEFVSWEYDRKKEADPAPTSTTEYSNPNIETWKKHWEDVEKRYSPRRMKSGSGRFDCTSQLRRKLMDQG